MKVVNFSTVIKYLITLILYNFNFCLKLKNDKEFSLKKENFSEKQSNSFEKINTDNYVVAEDVSKFFLKLHNIQEGPKLLETKPAFDGTSRDNQVEKLQNEIESSGYQTYENLIDLIKNNPESIMKGSNPLGIATNMESNLSNFGESRFSQVESKEKNLLNILIDTKGTNYFNSLDSMFDKYLDSINSKEEKNEKMYNYKINSDTLDQEIEI